MKRRLLSLVLAFVMVIGLLPVTALAAEAVTMTVKDASGNPVSGATVTVERGWTEKSGITDASGKVTLSFDQISDNRSYTVTAIKDGVSNDEDVLGRNLNGYTIQLAVNSSGSGSSSSGNAAVYLYTLIPGVVQGSGSSADDEWNGMGVGTIDSGFGSPSDYRSGQVVSSDPDSISDQISFPGSFPDITVNGTEYKYAVSGSENADKQGYYTIEWTRLVVSDGANSGANGVNPYVPASQLTFHLDGQLILNETSYHTVSFALKDVGTGNFVVQSDYSVRVADGYLERNLSVPTYYDKTVDGIKYVFDGWYVDSACTTKANFNDSDTIRQNTTYYARYNPLYTIAYTDGVSGVEIFADQSSTVQGGSLTPVFDADPSTAGSQNPFRTGYIFNGWSPAWSDTVTGSVTYTAQWAASTGTIYTVEHYFEDLSGNYIKDSAKTQSLAGKTGEAATALPLSGSDILGFNYDDTKSANTKSGTIAANGSLVLGLYYTRTRHSVTYQYTGTIPSGANALLPAGQTDVKYGQEMTVASGVSMKGYTFIGWESEEVTQDSNGKFSMPASDVVFTGHFTPSGNQYTVEHYLMNTDGHYPTTASHSTVYTNVKTNDSVSANTTAEHVGFTYDTKAANVTSGTVAADGSLTLKLYFKRNQYTVSYDYVNTVPGASALPAADTYYYEEEVTVAPAATAPGYTFSGWTVYTGDTAIEDGKMVMPDHDVVLHGSFNANAGTPYIVEHYFEDLSGRYNKDSTKTQNPVGKTGETATALPLSGNDILGFDYDDTKSAATKSGTITGTGSLVLKLYYTRTTHTVSYQYTGTVPNGATQPPAAVTYKYGQEVTVASGVSLTGYTFSGWSAHSITPNSSGKFSMPARDVIFSGHFDPSGNKYTVEHYLMDVDGRYPDEASHSTVYTNVKTNDSVTANTAAEHVGFTYDEGYSGNKEQGTVTADGSLTLKLYFKRNQYTVSYEYINTVPDASTLPAADTYYYDEEVTVAPAATAPGYTFSGWTIYTGDTAIEDGKMVMPNHAVVLRGAFNANIGTAYTVEHYFEELSGGYTIDDTKTQHLTGKTGDTATAMPLPNLIGYNYDDTKSASSKSGVIAGIGDTVLKLYYTRTLHDVSYQYTGTVPSGADALLPAGQTNVKYGQEVTVASDVSFAGYTFTGWSALSIAAGSNDKFDMPARDVIFSGGFEPSSNKYTVEHYLMDTEGNYPATTEHKHIYENVKTGDTVTATVSEHTGFTFDSANTKNVLEDTVAANGSTVLKLYYKRNQHTVRYEYYGDTLPTNVNPACDSNKVIIASGYGGTYYYGQTVQIANDATDGNSGQNFTFSGWSIRTGDTAISAGKMIMPDSDVVLRGSFTATGNTKYIVEHYFEQVGSGDSSNASNYDKDTGKTQEFTGKANEKATAVPLSGPDITGYSFNAVLSDTTRTGTITDTPVLALELYYSRTVHNVKYQYTGFVPTDATALPGETSYKFEQKVSRAADAEADGYTFSGWTPSVSLAVGSDGEFTMPVSDVVFTGHFDPKPNQYTVEHYLMGTNGKYPATASHSTVYKNVKTGDLVSANTDATHVGFTYDADNAYQITSGTVTAGGELTLKLYFERNRYNVSYDYINEPAGVSTLPADGTYYYGEEVAIAPEATAPGYTFGGWTVYTGDASIENGKMVMPNRAVVLHGFFNANAGTAYIVEHYFEDLSGNYIKDSTKTQNLTGKTEDTATAVPLSGSDIIGFSYDTDKSVASGQITGDGKLVLSLYYTRTTHTVSYQYTGTVPAGANALLPAGQLNVKYGQEVTLEPSVSLAGYIFSGWTAHSITPDVNGKFNMPARDLIFSGYFVPSGNQYTVEHYLMGVDGKYPATASHSIVYTNVKTNDPVTANTAAKHVGFTYDENYADEVTSGTVSADGSLTLKLYFKRNQYTVSYNYINTPTGASALPAGGTYYYGVEVQVAPAATAPGYSFSGWTIYTGDTAIENGKMVMPDHAVVLHGSFNASMGTAYTVEHYFEDLSGNYVKDGAKTQHLTGKTGEDTIAMPLPNVIGYNYDDVKSESTKSGQITGDGKLVLKLYYTRTTHKVSYQYTGTVPGEANSLLPVGASNVKYGQEVTLASGVSVTGYIFSGWSAHSITPDSGGKFSMPARDLIFTGHFTPSGNQYTVEHYLMGTDGTYPDTASHGTVYTNVETGDAVSVNTAVAHVGFTYDTEAANVISGTVAADGSLTLKLYFKRNQYTVSYDYVNAPAGASALPASGTYYYGEEVTIAPAATAPGYSFSGWTIYTGDTAIENGKMVMPDHAVVLHGTFNAKPDDVEPPVIAYVGSVTLTKVDADDNDTVLPGAKFDLYRGNQFVGSYVTDAAGKITVNLTSEGDYYFVETKSPAGYQLDSSKHSFVIRFGQSAKLTITNAKTTDSELNPPKLNKEDHFAYIIGKDDGLVHPLDQITRAETATIFFRMLLEESRQAYWTQENNFADVKVSDWFNNAASTLNNAGIMTGRPGGQFAPYANITRGEFATLAVRFFLDEDVEITENNLTDVKGHWAEANINLAYALGLITGYPDNTFKPDQEITRAEAMVIVNRVLERHPDKDHLLNNMITWPDNMDPNVWYYADVQEATNSHLYVLMTDEKGEKYEIWQQLLPVRDWAALEKEWSEYNSSHNPGEVVDVGT